MNDPVLQLSQNITLFPVVHGSGDFAWQVRRQLLEGGYDGLAVTLPPSFQAATQAAIGHLPQISVVLQREPVGMGDNAEWTPETDDNRETPFWASYVPIDPCQPVIAALRVAQEEHLAIAFIDAETACYEPVAQSLPDPYALKQVTPAQFAAAALPALARPRFPQFAQRIQTMVARLRQFDRRQRKILCVCSLVEWPWLRDAWHEAAVTHDDDHLEPIEVCSANTRTLTFLLGELPFITGEYERARRGLDADDNLSIDGVKQLLLAARDHYQHELGQKARRITPKLLQTYFQYVRNLALMSHRLTPALYDLVVAAKQIFGDRFAISVAETARDYPFAGRPLHDVIEMSIDKGRLSDGTLLHLKSRLPGPPVTWCSIPLKPEPPKFDQKRWQVRWNPARQCSWPPEDTQVERFRAHVKDVALAMLGNDLARTEKFSTSLKDGLDLRETLRHWHTGELHVKVLPPSRGRLDCVVMLFDVPADPRDYPWRVTWYAESHDESTLALFATNFTQTMVGPGIGQATYGGAMFLFPPRPIEDLWRDPQFDEATTLEERLLMAACRYAQPRHLAVLSESPPTQAWRAIARRYKKRLVHVPLSKFSQETIARLREFHVLNGQRVRSYAAEFIRKG